MKWLSFLPLLTILITGCRSTGARDSIEDDVFLMVYSETQEEAETYREAAIKKINMLFSLKWQNDENTEVP